jgi:hypothetical protein
MRGAGSPASTFDDLIRRRDRRQRIQRVSAGIVGAAVFAAVAGWLGTSALLSDGASLPATVDRSDEPVRPIAANGPLTWVADNDILMEGPNPDSPIVLARNVAEPGWKLNSFAWAPDGTRIALTVVEPLPQSVLACRLLILDVTEGTLTDVADCDHAGFGWQTVDWSPDGRRVVYAGPGGIHTVGADGSDPRQLTHDGGFDPSWSSDGRIAYAAADRGSILSIRSDGSDPQTLITDDGGPNPIFHPAWSPDATRIAYLRMEDMAGAPPGSLIGTGLWIADADGSDATKAASMDCCIGATEAFAWAPDGSKLIWTGTEIIFLRGDGSVESSFLHGGPAGLPGIDMSVAPGWRPLP